MNKTDNITVSILQPGYLPWLGFFDLINRSDFFIYYDDVQFDKQGWRNRNRIKTPNGPLWLSVPVLHKNKQKPKILEVAIDNNRNWAHKHIKSIKQFYSKAPFLKQYISELEELLTKSWINLIDLDFATTDLIMKWLDMDCSIHRSSCLNIEGDKSNRLLNICKHFGAANYLSGDAAQDYLDTNIFKESRINVIWQNYQHPIYPQLSGEFIPYLSIIDLLFNCGDESKKLIIQGA